MRNLFFDHPILYSSYECPPRHWELDPAGQPTQQIIETRHFHHPHPEAEEAQRRSRAG